FFGGGRTGVFASSPRRMGAPEQLFQRAGARRGVVNTLPAVSQPLIRIDGRLEIVCVSRVFAPGLIWAWGHVIVNAALIDTRGRGDRGSVNVLGTRVLTELLADLPQHHPRAGIIHLARIRSAATPVRGFQIAAGVAVWAREGALDLERRLGNGSAAGVGSGANRGAGPAIGVEDLSIGDGRGVGPQIGQVAGIGC